MHAWGGHLLDPLICQGLAAPQNMMLYSILIVVWKVLPNPTVVKPSALSVLLLPEEIWTLQDGWQTMGERKEDCGVHKRELQKNESHTVPTTLSPCRN